jgi:chromate transport protein ChrA
MPGMAAAVVGLVVVTTGRMVRASLRGVHAVAVAAATFLGVAVLGVNTVLVIAVMGIASGWLHRPRRVPGPPAHSGPEA